MKVSVLGAGVMGSGITQVAALGGHDVISFDIADEAIDKARETIRSGRFGLDSAVERGRITKDEADAAEARVRYTTNFDDTFDTDLVVEAVPERLDLKIRTFRDLDRGTPSHAILASNSSGFPISALAAATERPDRVIGWHWASPPPVMRLAEIARTPETSDETVKTVSELAAALGKNPIVINDTDRAWGYVANRIYRAVRVEAERVVKEGVATPEQVDQLLMDCYRWPMGPYGMSGGTRSGWSKS